MKKATKDKDFLKQPVYAGGPKALREFISQHLQYPTEALEKGIEGTVIVRYGIDHRGNVVETKLLAGIGHGCDEEAIRLVKMLRFSVGRTRGVKVLYHKDIQIHFHLPKQPTTQPADTELQYNVVPASKPAESKPSPSKGQSFTITVEW
jgi:protein TonB